MPHIIGPSFSYYPEPSDSKYEVCDSCGALCAKLFHSQGDWLCEKCLSCDACRGYNVEYECVYEYPQVYGNRVSNYASYKFLCSDCYHQDWVDQVRHHFSRIAGKKAEKKKGSSRICTQCSSKGAIKLSGDVLCGTCIEKVIASLEGSLQQQRTEILYLERELKKRVAPVTQAKVTPVDKAVTQETPAKALTKPLTGTRWDLDFKD